MKHEKILLFDSYNETIPASFIYKVIEVISYGL